MPLQSFEQGDVQYKKALLKTILYSFHPSTQDIREVAYDRMTKQLLWLGSRGGALALQLPALQRLLSKEISLTVTEASLIRILARLEKTHSIIIDKNLNTVRLLPTAAHEIQQIYSTAQGHLRGVVKSLYGQLPGAPDAMNAPFLYAVSNIFALLGDYSARLIHNNEVNESLIKTCIEKSADITSARYREIDRVALKDKLHELFENTQDPDYSSLKYHTAQNYFIAKAIRLDPSGQLLTRDLFDGATFVLDTNVLFHCFDPKMKDYFILTKLADFARQHNMHMVVTHISIAEISRWAKQKLDELSSFKDIDRIDELLSKRMKSDLLDLYHQKKREDKGFSVSQLSSIFLDPKATVESFFGTTIHYRRWFPDHTADQKVRRLSQKLNDLYYELHEEPKHGEATLHDALVMSWMSDSGSAEIGEKAWFLTKDYSLTSSEIKELCSCRVMTLDVFLQWLVPYNSTTERTFEAVFARLMQKRLLPQDKVLELKDFRILDQLNESIDSISPVNAEELVQYIKSSLPNIDYNNPRDRERVYSVAMHFFNDPELKPQKEYRALRLTADQYRDFIKNSEIARQARRRIAIYAALILPTVTPSIVIGAIFGDGANLFIKICNSWPFIAGSVGLVHIILLPLIFHKDLRQTIKSVFWSRRKSLAANPSVAELLSRQRVSHK
jgi:hypothetical protein